MFRIFISYKRLNKDLVLPIKDKIETETGEKCWIDIDGIESDAQFKNVIIKAINECEIMLFMYSKLHSQIVNFEKDWTIKEINFAQKKEKRIVFVNIDGTPLTDEFEFEFGTKQQVDAQNPTSIRKLIKDISSWLKNEMKNCEEKSQKNLHSDHAEKIYEITLINEGYDKLQMIKLINELLGLGLKKTKELVDNVPSVFPRLYTESEMQEFSYLIEEIGGVLQKKVCIQKNKLVDATQKAIIDSNAFCPCGSGKKFKDCHGKNVSFK